MRDEPRGATVSGMGLIRKTLAVGTLGTVHGSSKKQRVAAAQLGELQTIRRALTGEPAPRTTASLVSGWNDRRPNSHQRTAACAMAGPMTAEQRRAERAARDPKWAARQGLL